MVITSKQVLLLKAINVQEGCLPNDLDQILEKLEYKTTKQSLQFSIRSLVKKGLIVKCEQATREGKNRRPLALTQLGKEKLRLYVIPPNSIHSIGSSIKLDL